MSNVSRQQNWHRLLVMPRRMMFILAGVMRFLIRKAEPKAKTILERKYYNSKIMVIGVEVVS